MSNHASKGTTPLLSYKHSHPLVTEKRLPEEVLGQAHTILDDGAFYVNDAYTWMLQLPDGIADLIIADPPYNFSKEDWDLFPSWDDYINWSIRWITAAHRVLADHGSIYIFGNTDSISRIYPAVEDLFYSCRWLIWHYRNRGSTHSTDWVRSFDVVLHCRKSDKYIFNYRDIAEPYNYHTKKYPNKPSGQTSMFAIGKLSHEAHPWTPNDRGAKPRDVLDIPTTSGSSKEKTPHPTQKPEELMRRLILASSAPNSLVLDPFIGSGTTAVAARQLARLWMGNDINDRYITWAIGRVQNVTKRDPHYWIKYDMKKALHRMKVRCGNVK